MNSKYDILMNLLTAVLLTIGLSGCAGEDSGKARIQIVKEAVVVAEEKLQLEEVPPEERNLLFPPSPAASIAKLDQLATSDSQ